MDPCRIAKLVFAVLLANACAAGFARAHMPYITQVEKVALPDGQIGEMRLLRGDAIMIAPDPIRILLVGADGRLLARSHRSPAMVLICSGEYQCRGLDLDRDQVLEFDPATFQHGPEIPPSGEGLWSLEAGDAAWGFKTRPATLEERLKGEFVLAVRLQRSLITLVAAGALMGIAGLLIFRRPFLNGLFLLRMLVAITLLALAAPILVLALLGPSTDLLFFGPIGAGIASILFLFRYFGRAAAYKRNATNA